MEGFDPPDQTMEYMYKYLDQIAERKHKARIKKEHNPVHVGYWEIDERVARGEIQERVIVEIAKRLGKDHENYKRQYLSWRKREILPD